MSGDNNGADSNVADLTLERVRRIEAQIESIDAKIDALIDLASGSRADATSLRTEMAAQRADTTALLKLFQTMDKRLERIERRLDLTDAPAE